LIMATSIYAQTGKLFRMAEKLKLTDQQVEQIQEIKLRHDREMIRLKADLKLARLDLKEIMMKAKIDEKAALSKQDNISKVKASIDKTRLQHKLDIRRILTEDQFKQLQKMRMKHGPRGRRGPHAPGGFRGGPGCDGPYPMMGPGFGHGMQPPDSPEPPDMPDQPAPKND